MLWSPSQSVWDPITVSSSSPLQAGVASLQLQTSCETWSYTRTSWFPTLNQHKEEVGHVSIKLLMSSLAQPWCWCKIVSHLHRTSQQSGSINIHESEAFLTFTKENKPPSLPPLDYHLDWKIFCSRKDTNWKPQSRYEFLLGNPSSSGTNFWAQRQLLCWKETSVKYREGKTSVKYREGKSLVHVSVGPKVH